MKRIIMTILMTTVLGADPFYRAYSSDPVTAASCNSGDVQTAINNAVDGNTVQIPAGTCTWNSGVSWSGKAITIQGAGAGRLEGSSRTSLTVGTGGKSFVIQTNTIVSGGFTVGETIRAVYKPDMSIYMEGTVSSWDGTTLALNISSTGGSGTRAIWNFIAPAKTTIIGNSSTPLFAFTEGTSTTTTLEGFYVDSNANTPKVIVVSPQTGGKYTIFHDLRFGCETNAEVVDLTRNRALFYHVYTYAATPWQPDAGHGSCQLVDQKNQDDIAAGWNSPNTMGMDDTTGLHNLYIEDSYFSGIKGATDFDDNSRAVVRYSVLDNAMLESHGSDTSTYGVLHVEYYNNVFLADDTSSSGVGGQNIAAFIDSRGGTGIVANNVMENLNQYGYGDKPEIRLELQNLIRNAGLWATWGSNTPGYQYPAPRQNGMGHRTETTSVTYTTANTGSGGHDIYGTYLGDFNPWYQWGNTGTGQYANPSVVNFSDPGTQYDDVSGYIQIGRDWINGPKPGYIPYTYPHPLRLGTNSVPTSTPHPADTNSDYKITANEATTYGSCWKSAPSTPPGCPTGVDIATMDFAVRAGTIWNSSVDGTYHYVGGNCQGALCWAP